MYIVEMISKSCYKVAQTRPLTITRIHHFACTYFLYLSILQISTKYMDIFKMSIEIQKYTLILQLLTVSGLLFHASYMVVQVPSS